MFYLNSTLNFGIPPVFVFQLEVYYKVDRLLTGLTAQQKGTTARWYSNKGCLKKKRRHFKIFNLVFKACATKIEMFYLNTIEQLFLFVEQLDQLEVCLPDSRLLAGIPILAAFQNLDWNSNKMALI